MKKAIFPIDVELWYETPEERDAKVKVIKELLTAIIKSKDKFNDMKKLNNYLAIIKGSKLPKWYYYTNILSAIVFVTIVSIMILWITSFRWELVSSVYLWWPGGYWYALNEKTENLYYTEFKITKWCNESACITDKWAVFKRNIDYYTFLK